MERGPLALFGAIVAVGLGPALWLGAQFGSIQIAPSRPPVVSEQNSGPEQLLGGSGAGDNPAGTENEVIRSTPQADVKQITTAPTGRRQTSPAPERTTDRPRPSPSTTTTGPAPSQSSSTPATGGDESEGPGVPPEPPAGGEDPSEPTDPGGGNDSGGAGAGETETGPTG